MDHSCRKQRLPQSEQLLYETLYAGLHTGMKMIDCGGTDPYVINRVIKDVLLDHPALCWFDGKWEYNGAVVPRYVLAPTAENTLLGKAEQVLYQIRASGEDFVLESYLWLLKHVIYDFTAPNSQNAYGALIEGRALCKGIAKAYQLLMHKVQIPCILTEGTLDGRTKHVWNMVFVNNHWYHVDVTMGYPCFRHLVGSRDCFGGYLRTTEQLRQSHGIRNPEALPDHDRGEEERI